MECFTDVYNHVIIALYYMIVISSQLQQVDTSDERINSLNLKINQFQAGRMIQYLFVDLIKNKMAKSGIKMVLRRSMQGHLLLEEGDQLGYLLQ